MPHIFFYSPHAALSGETRAISWFREVLDSDEFSELYICVAFSRVGALQRIRPGLDKFNRRDGRVKAVFGVDHMGTSRQALEFALNHFDEVFVCHHPSPFVTFHPKIYSAVGALAADMLIGSSNLTSGGLETNFEAGVRLRYRLPEEQQLYHDAISGFREILGHPNTLRLDGDLLAALDARRLLLDEESNQGRTGQGAAGQHDDDQDEEPLFPRTAVAAPSPLPKPTRRHRPATGRPAATGRGVESPVVVAPRVLLIQVKPHHNGEILLSKSAVNQNKGFFGWPFKAQTVPKLAINPAYPQRDPDPVTDWTVYDTTGNIRVAISNYGLNTVYYKRRAEIRITVAAELRDAIPPYSILKMTSVMSAGRDYLCDVFPPGSPQFNEYIPLCNQAMPPGGDDTPRRFGWL